MAQQFKVLGHETWYDVEEVAPGAGELVGCPGATHRIKGQRTGTTYWGRFTWNGKRVTKIPGTNRRGVKAVFNAQFDEDREQLPGHITTD